MATNNRDGNRQIPGGDPEKDKNKKREGKGGTDSGGKTPRQDGAGAPIPVTGGRARGTH